MPRALACLVVVVAVLGAASAHAEARARRILVLDFASHGVDENIAKTVTSLVAVELGKRGGLEVLSSTDVRAALDMEAARQAAGCDEQSCLAELAGALGVELVAHG